MSPRLVLLVALSLACRARPAEVAPGAAPGGAPGAPAGAPAEAAAAAEPFVLVLLATGPRASELTPDEVAAAGRGHQANIGRLVEEGWLLLAGPFGEPRHDPSWRGLFFFDVADVARAAELTESDPAVAAGALALEAWPLRTTSPLRCLPELEARAREAREARGESGWEGRAYQLLLAPDTPAAARLLDALEADGKVLLRGALGGARAGELVAVLDARTPEEGRAIFALGAEVEALHPWFATSVLVDLPGASCEGTGRQVAAGRRTALRPASTTASSASR